MERKYKSINEEINRIKSLFTEDRMFGNLISESGVDTTVEVFKDKRGTYQYANLPDGTYWYKDGGSKWKQQRNEKGWKAIDKRIKSDKVDSMGQVDISTIGKLDDDYFVGTTKVSGDNAFIDKDGDGISDYIDKDGGEPETEVGGGEKPSFDIEGEITKTIEPIRKETIKILEEIQKDPLFKVGAKMKDKESIKNAIDLLTNFDPSKACEEETINMINNNITLIDGIIKDNEGLGFAGDIVNKVKDVKTNLEKVKSECERLKKELENSKQQSTTTTNTNDNDNDGIPNSIDKDTAKKEESIDDLIAKITTIGQGGVDVVDIGGGIEKKVGELSDEEKVQALDYYDKKEGREDRKNKNTKTEDNGNLNEGKCKTHLRQMWKTWKEGTTPKKGSTDWGTTESCWCSYGEKFDKATKIKGMITNFEGKNLINLENCAEGGVIGAKYTIKNSRGQVLGHVKKVNDNKYRFSGKKGRTFIEKTNSGYIWNDTSNTDTLIAKALNVDLNKKSLIITKSNGAGDSGLFRIENKMNEWLDNFVGSILR